MFGIFRKKKPRPKVAEIIKQALSQGETDLHIDLFVDDQILFQVVPAKFYANRGILDENSSGFIELHFFNKNKTFTTENERFAKKLYENGELIYFEEPKGNHNYIRLIGEVPEEIENIIYDRINTIYSNIEFERVSIEYVGYIT